MVERPVYKHEPYESPARLPGNVGTAPGNGAAPVNPPTNSPQAPPLIHSITETPRTAGETETIVKAANSLYRVLADKITWHEGELKKLRAVFQGFATAGQKAPDVAPSLTNDDFQKLLRFADAFEKEGK